MFLNKQIAGTDDYKARLSDHLYAVVNNDSFKLSLHEKINLFDFESNKKQKRDICLLTYLVNQDIQEKTISVWQKVLKSLFSTEKLVGYSKQLLIEGLKKSLPDIAQQAIMSVICACLLKKTVPLASVIPVELGVLYNLQTISQANKENSVTLANIYLDTLKDLKKDWKSEAPVTAVLSFLEGMDFVQADEPLSTFISAVMESRVPGGGWSPPGDEGDTTATENTMQIDVSYSPGLRHRLRRLSKENLPLKIISIQMNTHHGFTIEVSHVLLSLQDNTLEGVVARALIESLFLDILNTIPPNTPTVTTYSRIAQLRMANDSKKSHQKMIRHKLREKEKSTSK